MFQHSSLNATVAAMVLSMLAGTARAGGCTTDLDGSGTNDVADLLTLLGQWGPCPGCAADFDGNDEVGVSDLLVMLGAWGPCLFDYPDYENELAEEIAAQQLGVGDPLTVPQDMYDRYAHDIEAIWAMRPETSGAQHIGDWVEKEMLVGVDTAFAQDEYAEAIDFYQATILNSWFDGTIEHIGFPRPVNVLAMSAAFAALPQIEYAEPNFWIQLPAGTPRYVPIDIGGDAIEWIVTVSWWSDGPMCEFGFLCDCYTSYQFVSLPNGTVTLLDLFTVPYSWNAGGDCSDLPPA